MQIIYLDQKSTKLCQNSVLTIGNFDAVHLGHQQLIKSAITQAEDSNLASGASVLTFEPHPRRLFRPDDSAFRVTPLDVKLHRLEKLGVHQVFICPFDWTLAEMTSDQFMEQVLQEKLAPEKILVGADFHFGMHRTGTVQSLKQFGFDVEPINLKTDHNHGVISATRIRGLIQSGHIDEANQLLGWDWEIWGEVQHGDKRGRTIGYPTANMDLHETIHPAYGVYAGEVKIGDSEICYRAATNIGIRPMFESKTALVECYLLDFNGDLYGQKLRFRPFFKIRNELKFDDLDQLMQQMQQDCQIARDAKPLALQ